MDGDLGTYLADIIKEARQDAAADFYAHARTHEPMMGCCMDNALRIGNFQVPVTDNRNKRSDL